jgi:hypothetical protein
MTSEWNAAIEAAAQAIENGHISVVFRYTPFPHNEELTLNPLKDLAAHIRALAKPAPQAEGGATMNRPPLRPLLPKHDSGEPPSGGAQRAGDTGERT